MKTHCNGNLIVSYDYGMASRYKSKVSMRQMHEVSVFSYFYFILNRFLFFLQRTQRTVAEQGPTQHMLNTINEGMNIK